MDCITHCYSHILCSLFFATLCNKNSVYSLHVTWECFDSHLKAGQVYETSVHKTGKFYDVAVRIEADQITFLDEMRERMKSEYPTMPSLMFANTKSQQETKMSYLIRDTFTELFQDDIMRTQYENSGRCTWLGWNCPKITKTPI